MKQGTVSKTFITYSALSLSLLGMVAHAQLIELDPPTDATSEVAAVETAAPKSATRPVAVSEAMSLQAIPAAVPVAVVAAPVQVAAAPMQVQPSQASAYQTQAQTQVVNPATSLMNSGVNSAIPLTTASSSNSNGGGTQINLNIKSDQDAKLAQNQGQGQDIMQDQSRVNELRMEKKIREEVNNERLQEKIEEDRIYGERGRTKGIERFKFETSADASASSSGLDTVPVAPMGSAAAAASGNGATAIATVTTEGSSGFLSDVRFKITPQIGKRWFENNVSAYRANNVGVAGLGLEGQVTNMLSIEGNFSYGRDRFTLNNVGYGAMAYSGVGYAGYGGGYSGYGGGYNTGYAGYAGQSYGGQYGFQGGMITGPNGFAIPAPQSRDSFEAAIGLKLGYTVSRVRPFGAIGIGGLFQKYNIDNVYTTAQLKEAGLTRTTDFAVGNFGGGLDMVVSRSLNLGLRFDYQALLNRSNSSFSMNQIWGDAKNRYRLTGSAQLVF